MFGGIRYRDGRWGKCVFTVEPAILKISLHNWRAGFAYSFLDFNRHLRIHSYKRRPLSMKRIGVHMTFRATIIIAVCAFLMFHHHVALAQHHQRDRSQTPRNGRSSVALCSQTLAVIENELGDACSLESNDTLVQQLSRQLKARIAELRRNRWAIPITGSPTPTATPAGSNTVNGGHDLTRQILPPPTDNAAGADDGQPTPPSSACGARTN